MSLVKDDLEVKKCLVECFEMLEKCLEIFPSKTCLNYHDSCVKKCKDGKR